MPQPEGKSERPGCVFRLSVALLVKISNQRKSLSSGLLTENVCAARHVIRITLIETSCATDKRIAKEETSRATATVSRNRLNAACRDALFFSFVLEQQLDDLLAFFLLRRSRRSLIIRQG